MPDAASYDRVRRTADARPCGTPAAVGELDQIICPTQITGGLQLTPLQASTAGKL